MEAATSTKYAERVNALLAKAESTEFEAEREAFIAKAQELMTTYAIDEAMLASQREDAAPEEIIESEEVYVGVYQVPHSQIGVNVARANGCRVISGTWWGPGRREVVHFVGYESDVRRAQMLTSSLLVQCAGALAVWSKQEGNLARWMSSGQKHLAKRQFCLGFARGLREQLREAREAGEREAAKAHAEREEVTQEEASESVALVIRERADNVNDWVDQTYGKLQKGRPRNLAFGGASASQAGREAGRSADATASSDRLRDGARGELVA